MRFICNQDVFILIEHLLPKGYGFFIFQLAVIENASANSKSSLCIYAASGFIHHLTLRHPCLPSRGMHVRILFLEKVDDSFPWTCWKPLAAWTNSCDKGKRGVQINPPYLLCFPGEKRIRFSDDAQINPTLQCSRPLSISNMTLFTIRAAGIMKVIVADHNY